MNGDKKLNGANEACPSVETVSAWVDGCLSPAEPDAVHISQCEACLRVAATYRQLDQQLHTYLHASEPLLSPEATAAKIRLKLKRQTLPSNGISFPRFLFRVAAAVVLIGGGALAVHYLMQYQVTDYVFSVAPSSVTVQVVPAVNPAPAEEPVLRTQLNDYRPNIQPIASAVNVPNLAMANFGQSGNSVIRNATDRTAADMIEPVVTVDDTVRHVWLAQGKNTAEEMLRAVRKQYSVDDVVFDKQKSCMTFTLRSSCQNVVGLVRHFSAEGAELLTPVAPQPEQNYFTNSPDSPVVYKAEVFYDAAPGKK